MLSTCIITVDIDLDHLTEIIFIRFLYCKVSLPHPHPPYSSLWKEVTMCHPCLRSRNSCVTSLSSDYVCNILEMFPQRRNLSFYSIYLFISIQTRGYSFLVWHINQYYFISCLNCSSFGHGGSLGWLNGPFDLPASVWGVCLLVHFFFNISFLYGTVRCPWLMADLVYFMPQPFLQGVWFLLSD